MCRKSEYVGLSVIKRKETTTKRQYTSIGLKDKAGIGLHGVMVYLNVLNVGL